LECFQGGAIRSVSVTVLPHTVKKSEWAFNLFVITQTMLQYSKLSVSRVSRLEFEQESYYCRIIYHNITYYNKY